MTVDRHGFYPGLDLAEYLADPFDGGSLSHSGMKTLIQKTPAHYAYERAHGRPSKRAFDLGHAAHAEALGDGMDVVIVQKTTRDKQTVDADDYQTKSAQAHRDAIYAEGKVPLLRDEYDTVKAMGAALAGHDLAMRLLGSGDPEVSAFALHQDSGVTIRVRFDIWPGDSDRIVIPDYKTTSTGADETSFGKSAANYGYDIADATYCFAARQLTEARDAIMLFVVQETTAPFLVNVVQLDHTARQIGAAKMRRAINTYRECTDTGHWPGYRSTRTATIAALPAWEERLWEQDIAS